MMDDISDAAIEKRFRDIEFEKEMDKAMEIELDLAMEKEKYNYLERDLEFIPVGLQK